MALNTSSYDPVTSNPPRPSGSSSGGLFVLLLVALGLALAIIFFPGIRRHLTGLFATPSSIRMKPTVVVWAEKLAGNYYCAGSPMYGRRPGNLMKQGDALTQGFQPDLGQYCQDPQTKDSTGVDTTNDGNKTSAHNTPAHPLRGSHP